MTPHEVAQEVKAAEARIRPRVRETMLYRSTDLSEFSGADVHCKLENLQHTGSFKFRGAVNKLLSLTPSERTGGVVAASTGNHGAAVARAARDLQTPCHVYVPTNASPTKLEAIEILGAKIEPVEGDPVEAERTAREVAASTGQAYVAPYNDPKVIGGQGTIGVELARQLPDLDAVFVSVGGGGLISGIAGYLKLVHPHVKVVGCSPANSAVMYESLKAGRILDIPSLPTLSDGTAGGIESDAITFDLCRLLVDDLVTVAEEEIATCLRNFVMTEHLLIEGAAAVAVAGFRAMAAEWSGQKVAIVICGGNISPEMLRSVL